MKKDVLLVSIFFFCIITIILDYTVPKPPTAESFFIFLILLSGSVAYIGIFFTYIIVVRGYKKLKEFFYDEFLLITRQSISGHNIFSKDLVRAYVFCFSVNFCSLYFISIAPISEILSVIPGLDFINLDSLKFSIFNIDTLSKFGQNFTAFPFTSFGTIILFILRCLHRRPSNKYNEKYPGSRAILAFCYTVLVIILMNAVITAEELGFDKDQINNSEFSKSFSLPLMFTIFNFFSVFVFILIDRYLIRKDLSN